LFAEKPLRWFAEAFADERFGGNVMTLHINFYHADELRSYSVTNSVLTARRTPFLQHDELCSYGVAKFVPATGKGNDSYGNKTSLSNIREFGNKPDL
jgi:hypothetical protein